MKTAVVTGATSGIGNYVLKSLLREGYKVFAGYRDIKHKKELMILSDDVIPFRIDMTKKWTIEDAIKTISSSCEKIDVLVNAAGKVVAGPLETLSVDKVREQFEVNAFSHFELAQGLFDKLDGGKIINISSMASYGVFPFLAPYCASKRTLDMMFNSLRIETGTKVQIISVKPGVIATPLWEKSIDLNKDNFGAGKYKIVGDYLVANAIRNSNSGLSPKTVANKVMEIIKAKNPKNSYTIGFDAFCVEMLSRLPQCIIDRIVEDQLRKRVAAQLDKVLLTGVVQKTKEAEPEIEESVKIEEAPVVEEIENPDERLEAALQEAMAEENP